MTESIATTKSNRTVSLKRRELLCAAVAAGGVLMASGPAIAGLPGTIRPSNSDPQLVAALRKYGGEFGQAGKGGNHGDL